ncbi:MAG TPA: DVUA0089 family protein, partial [Planctomycetaceae bacterium]|nr:DVUA0089 family protein [Planctomycetaceae bacterium]
VLNAVWAAVPESEPNNTLDIAEDLGTLLADLSLGRSGAIGDAAEETADVDWFQFHLEQPSDVTLTARSPLDGTSVQVGLSLFNTSPFTGEDIQTLLGYRLLAQATSDSSSDEVQLAKVLAPGTYFVAVSGANNLAFHPFLENSGYVGPGGDYELQIAATSLGLSDTDGPVVLSADPAIDSVQSDSPLVVRVQFSHELDPYTISIDDTVRFTYSSNADFGDGDEVSVPLMMQSFSSAASELQLMPAAPLKPGYYQIHLAGDVDVSSSVLMDFLGQPLGSNADFPNGRDFDFTFQINGSEGTVGDSVIADDTPDGAHELGELTGTGVFQVAGTIGDDPYYDPNVDWLLNPANDVDMYHFQVHGEGSFSLAAEVFAGRIGSPLDPGVSLFQRLEDGSLQFVVGNNNTLNPITATNWFTPIFTDAALFAGLTEGDYFVAVSSGQNTP